MRKEFLFIILSFLILSGDVYSQKTGNCQERLSTVENAFSSFVKDSNRRQLYFRNATEAAESILRYCPLNEISRRKINIQKNILDLYTWCLKSFDDFNDTRDFTQPLNIKFFEKKVDSLENIPDVAFQPYINYVLGIYYLRIAKNYPLATNCFRKALDTHKDWIPALNELAWAYMLNHKNDSARIVLDRCIQLEPGYSRSYVTRGYMYGNAKDMTQAIEDFRKALSIDKKLAAAYFALGWWSGAVAVDSDSTEYYYQRSLDADPEFMAANYILGSKKFDRSDFFEAEKYFRKFIDVNPHLPEGYFMMAELYRKKGDTVNMSKQYDSTILLDSSYLYILGYKDHDNRNYQKAIEAYKKGLLYKNDKWTNYNLGLCFYYLAIDDSSIFYFKKSVEIDSAWAEPHAWLGYVYKIQGNTEKAIEHLGKAFKLDFDWALNRYFPLQVSEKLRKGDTIEAFKILKDGTREGCDYCGILKNALMYEHGYDNAERDYDEAKQWYRIILEKDSINYGAIAIEAIIRLYESHKIQMDDLDTLLKYRQYSAWAVNNKSTYNGRFIEAGKKTRIDELLLKLALSDSLKKDIAGDYNDFGWYALLIQDFVTAKEAIEKGLAIDSTNLYLKSNIPHILLFTDETEKAKQMYLTLKDERFHKDSQHKTFKDAFLADFDDFEKNANFPPALLQKINMIRKILNN